MDEIKAAQVAARLLEKERRRGMNCGRLLNLLYLVDREKLLEIIHPFIDDKIISVEDGCVHGNLQNMIQNNTPSFWNDHMQCIDEMVTLTANPGDGELSDGDCRRIDVIYRKFSKMDDKELSQWILHLPERQNKALGEIIDPLDILKYHPNPEQAKSAYEDYLSLQKSRKMLLVK